MNTITTDIPTLFDYTDMSTEGLIDSIRKWLADRRDRKNMERLEKNQLEYENFRTSMFNDYRSHVIGRNIDTISVPKIEEFARYLKVFEILLKRMMEVNPIKLKSKLDVHAVLIRNANRIIEKTKDGGFRVTLPEAIEVRFSSSGWSRLATVNNLEQTLIKCDIQAYRWYREAPKMIDSLNEQLQRLSGDELNKAYSRATTWMNLIDFVENVLSKLISAIWKSMRQIAHSA